MSKPVLNTNLLSEGAENEEEEGGSSPVVFACGARRLLSESLPANRGAAPGPSLARSNGARRSPHAWGRGVGRDPRPPEKDASPSAWASYLVINLLPLRGGGEAAGQSRGDQGRGWERRLGVRPTRSSRGTPSSRGSDGLPGRRRAAGSPHAPTCPAPDGPGGLQKAGAWCGAPSPCLRPGTTLTALG